MAEIRSHIKMKLSVIIPVYNEKDTIGEIIDRILEVPVEKELIVVDDGSSDGTRDILDGYKDHEDINIILHDFNQGKGAAIRTAISHIRGDIAIIQDADLEYNPDDYLRLIEPVKKKISKVVYGSRFLNRSNRHSYYSFYLGGRLLSILTNLLYSQNITDEPTCYKVFSADLLKAIPLKCNGFEFCPEVTARISKMGIKIHEIPIDYHPRSIEQGKKINFLDGVQAIWTLIKYRFVD